METLPPDPTDSTPITAPHLTLDLEFYQSYLDCPHFTDTEKREMVEALWRIIVTFVDLGFGIHPAQQTDAEICGKVDPAQDPASLSEIAALDSSHTATDRSA